MALTFRRRRNIEPMPRQDFGLAVRGGAEPIGELADDYLVEGEELPNRSSATAQIVQLLQVVLIVVMAVLSLAVFWLLGLVLNIF